MANVTSSTTYPEFSYLEFLSNQKHADLIIDCRGVSFKVHRIIVCAQSSIIDQTVIAEIARDPAVQNGGIPCIDLSDQAPEILSQAILFMYTGDYDRSELPEFYNKITNCDDRYPSSIIDCGKVDVQVYNCANTFEIESLKNLAARRFLNEVPKLCENFRFADVLHSMYTTTPLNDEKLRLATTKLFLTSPAIKIIDKSVQSMFDIFKPAELVKFDKVMDEIRSNVEMNVIKETLDFVNTKGYCKKHNDNSLMKPDSFFVVKYEDGTIIIPNCDQCAPAREKSLEVSTKNLSTSESF